MSVLARLEEEESWEAFYCHKLSQGNLREREPAELRSFIDSKEYLPVLRRIGNGEGLSLPKKSLINKSRMEKKRAVYSFPREENYVLKLLAFLLRDYDHLFAPNLYSFRKHSGVKKATEDVLRIPRLDGRYVYKADVSNYFNSVPIPLILPELEECLRDDMPLFHLLRGILENPYVEFEGEIISESKGIMAGIPVSAFLANFYLRGLDHLFYSMGVPYLRYSDDILVFAKDREELETCIKIIHGFLAARGLCINPEKERISLPGEKWDFLGFSYHRGVIDISEVSFEKLKGKMRRKTRALARWASKKGVSGECAARAFVKRFHAKLFDNPTVGELTWSRWFFPVINTDATLKKIDSYMQDCIRFLASGTRTKARFSFRYEDLKSLGYHSLVNEYYKSKDD